MKLKKILQHTNIPHIGDLIAPLGNSILLYNIFLTILRVDRSRLLSFQFSSELWHIQITLIVVQSRRRKKPNLETEKLSADLISTQRALMFPAVSIDDDNLFKLTLNDKMKTKRILWNEGWDGARPRRKDSYQVLSRQTITIGEGTRKLILKIKLKEKEEFVRI